MTTQEGTFDEANHHWAIAIGFDDHDDGDVGFCSPHPVGRLDQWRRKHLEHQAGRRYGLFACMGAMCVEWIDHRWALEDAEPHVERKLWPAGILESGCGYKELTNLPQRLVALALGLVALAGCSGVQSAPSASQPAVLAELGVPGADALPPLQAAALADGVVNREEYAQGFEAFARCAEDRGDPLDLMGTDAATGLIKYGTSDRLGVPGEPASSSQGICYEENFSWIEFVFQVTDPAVREAGFAQQDSLYATEGAACLARNGIDAPSEVDTRTPEGLEWFGRYTKLASEQKC